MPIEPSPVSSFQLSQVISPIFPIFHVSHTEIYYLRQFTQMEANPTIVTNNNMNRYNIDIT